MSVRPAEASRADDAAIPHPPGRLLLLGDVRGASRDKPMQDSIRIGRELGPIFARKFLHLNLVFVYGSDLVAEVVDESRFAKHVGAEAEQLRQITGDGLSTARNDEPNWRLAHDILLAAYSQSAMRRYHPMMLGTVGRLTATWDRHVDGEPVRVTEDMTKVTLETIAKVGFGYDFDLFGRDGSHPFVDAMNSALRQALNPTGQIPVLGKLVNRAAVKRQRATIGYLHGVVDDVTRRRKDSGDTGMDDMLGLMLHARHEQTGERLSDQNIRNQVITSLIAGSETSTGALAFALHYLATEPGLLATAQAEVDEVWGAAADPVPGYEQVTKLRFIRRVVEETLRLWPPGPVFAREARADTTIGGRYPVKRGEWVLVLVPLLHREPEWGADAEEFDPDRFLPERVKARPAHVYRPWGTGERACIGRSFALHEVVLTLGMLVHRYDLHPQPGYRLQVQERLSFTPKDLRLTLSRRRPAR